MIFKTKKFIQGSIFILMALLISTNIAWADPRCKQLEDLNREYMGVVLTSEQKQLKKQLISWYRENCNTRHAGRSTNNRKR
jgi:hypothetical protein